MFDVNNIKRRYFKIKIGQLILDVEPPKVEVLKKVTELSKANNETIMSDLAEAIKLILNKNKTRYKVSDEVINDLDLDQMKAILVAFFNWVRDERNSKN